VFYVEAIEEEAAYAKRTQQDGASRKPKLLTHIGLGGGVTALAACWRFEWAYAEADVVVHRHVGVAEGMTKIRYSGYRFPPDIIHQAIWLYLRFTLSFRDVEDSLAERGIAVS
jgi:hypothetical protein